MTTSNITEFREKVAADPAIQLEVRKLMGVAGSPDLAGLVELGTKNGCQFSEQEVSDLFANDNDELSDFEMEMVSAGFAVDCKMPEI